MSQPLLPWLAAPLAQALATHRGHALLWHAAPGNGAFALTLGVAQAWLCEGRPDDTAVACGQCASCRLVQSRLHPDLYVLLPEQQRRQQGWLLADDKPESDDAKRKPSRQIRIDEVRGLIDWATRTSGRGRGKVALLQPAESLNLQSASALLKTLEEPPPGTRLLLATADPALLLPTVRSRCQHQRLAEPDADSAVAWLTAQAMPASDARVLLAACSGRPLDAVALAEAGVDAARWQALPGAVARGDAAALAGWPLPRAIDALLKLAHDALARAGGAEARYFPSASVPAHARADAVAAWSRELQRVARHAEHPWHEALLVESLVASGAAALAAAGRPGARSGFATLPA